MPNTVTPDRLRAMYHARHSSECPLSSGEILTIWHATRRGNARGRNIIPAELERRMETTLQAMHLRIAAPSTLAEPNRILAAGLAFGDGALLVRIPEPDKGAPMFGIAPGWHHAVELLRLHKWNPDAVQYIADMIEI